MPENASSEKWIRQCSPLEERFEYGHQNSVLLVGYCLRFVTKSQLTKEHMETVFKFLLSTCPNLRLSLQWRDKKLWIKEMDNPRFDFQMIDGGDVLEEYNANFNKQYDTIKGPMWAARLIPISERHPKTKFPEENKVFPCTNSSAVDESSYANSMSNEGYNYSYHLLIGFHHMVADGYSVMRIYAFILKYINDVLNEKQLHSESQFASIVNVDQEIELCQAIEKQIMQDKRFNKEKRIRQAISSHRPLILDAYPVNDRNECKTSNLTHHLDEDTTKEFIRKCKKEKVTFHSGMTSVISAATAEMLLAAGFEQDCYDIRHVQILDHRRYNGNVHNSFGACVGYANSTDIVHKNYLESFWRNTKNYNSNFLNIIRSQQSLENDVMNRLLRPVNFDMNEQFVNPNMPSSYFATSNMLDITEIIGDCGEQVRAEWIHGATSNHRSGVIAVHIFQTLRGRLQYAINYSTQHISKATARSLAQNVFKVMRSVIRL